MVLWVIQSGACEELNATFFHYSKNRTKAIALELLKNFHGYLTTDAYKVCEYLGNEDIKHNFCWSHCRRYFIESIPLDTKGKEIPGSKGAEARGFIDSLFRVEKEIKELFADTPAGAKASAIAYTLAESAKANDLNVYEYFRYLLEQMPNNDFALHPEVIDALLPWSQELPDKCCLSRSKKKHLKK